MSQTHPKYPNLQKNKKKSSKRDKRKRHTGFPRDRLVALRARPVKYSLLDLANDLNLSTTLAGESMEIASDCDWKMISFAYHFIAVNTAIESQAGKWYRTLKSTCKTWIVGKSKKKGVIRKNNFRASGRGMGFRLHFALLKGRWVTWLACDTISPTLARFTRRPTYW